MAQLAIDHGLANIRPFRERDRVDASKKHRGRVRRSEAHLPELYVRR